mmetsp:Transcript_23790/g.46612  ORF Transcript_23790/g.46612 Transcript_23790/m.46612 type:complete len:335 (-) Transcript_23790:302-1306(-)
MAWSLNLLKAPRHRGDFKWTGLSTDCVILSVCAIVAAIVAIYYSREPVCVSTSSRLPNESCVLEPMRFRLTLSTFSTDALVTFDGDNSKVLEFGLVDGCRQIFRDIVSVTFDDPATTRQAFLRASWEMGTDGLCYPRAQFPTTVTLLSGNLVLRGDAYTVQVRDIGSARLRLETTNERVVNDNILNCDNTGNCVQNMFFPNGTQAQGLAPTGFGCPGQANVDLTNGGDVALLRNILRDLVCNATGTIDEEDGNFLEDDLVGSPFSCKSCRSYTGIEILSLTLPIVTTTYTLIVIVILTLHDKVYGISQTDDGHFENFNHVGEEDGKRVELVEKP